MSVAYSKPSKEAIVAKPKRTKENIGDEVKEAEMGQIIFSKYGHSTSTLMLSCNKTVPFPHQKAESIFPFSCNYAHFVTVLANKRKQKGHCASSRHSP